jgi:hypothetical protein
MLRQGRRIVGVGSVKATATAIFSRFGFAFTPAFGREETASRWAFRRGAEAPLYLKGNG